MTNDEEEAYMSTSAEIAALAGSAVINSMVGDVWTYARSRCAALLGRHAPDEGDRVLARLDAYQQAVAAAGPDGFPVVAADFERLVVELFGAVAARSREAADAVQALTEELKTAPSQGVAHSNLTYRNVKAGHDFIWSGNNTHISREK